MLKNDSNQKHKKNQTNPTSFTILNEVGFFGVTSFYYEDLV